MRLADWVFLSLFLGMIATGSAVFMADLNQNYPTSTLNATMMNESFDTQSIINASEDLDNTIRNAANGTNFISTIYDGAGDIITIVLTSVTVLFGGIGAAMSNLGIPVWIESLIIAAIVIAIAFLMLGIGTRWELIR